MTRNEPSLLSVILGLPLLALFVLIAIGWLVVYPHMARNLVEAEEADLRRDGWPTALEITRRAKLGSELDFDYLDRIALRAGYEHVFLVGPDGRTLFANDVLTQSRHVDRLPIIPAVVRQAIPVDGCKDGLVAVAGARHLIGCWPIDVGPETGSLTQFKRGHLIATTRIDDKIADIRDDLGFHALQIFGIGAALMGIVLFVLQKYVLRPVFSLSDRLVSTERGDGVEGPAITGTREITRIASVLERTFASLRTRESQIDAILNTTADGIITVEADGRIIQANAAAEKLFGYRRADLVGKDLSILMDAGDARRHPDHLREFERSGRSQTNFGREVAAVRKDGSTFLAQINVARAILRGTPFFTASVRDVTAEKLFEFRMHKLAHMDSELGIPNRLSWQTELGALVGPQASGTGFSIVVINVRNIDELVVTFGTRMEALALTAIHHAVIDLLQSHDISARISRSRLGYVVPTSSSTTPAVIAAGFAAILRKGLMVGESSIFPDIFAVVIPDAERYATGDDLLQEIEAAGSWAMQTADGRATPVLIYDASVSGGIRARTRIAADLPDAIRLGEIYPVYQPKIDLRSGALCGVECLARWKRTDGSFVSPADFVPVAEKLGMIDALDSSLSEVTLGRISANNLGMPAGSVVSINASAREFDDADWINRLTALAARFGISPKLIEIEVTESAILDDIAKVAATLGRLRAAGFRVAIDDFGTGQASFTYLKKLPADIVKIDQSFVRDLTKSKSSQAIVRSTVALAHELEMEVIAEGVEDEETARMLAEFGCDYGQGWHYGRPMDHSLLEAFAADHGRRLESAAGRTPAR